MRRSLKVTAGLLAALIGVAGCAQPQSSGPRKLTSVEDRSDGANRIGNRPIRVDRSAPAPAPAPAPVAAPAPQAAPAPVAAAPASSSVGRLFYPTGDQATSAIMLEKILPSELVVNQPFDYTIKVTNISRLRLEGVQVVDTVPANLRITDTAGGRLDGSNLTFNVGNLNVGESKTFVLKAVATGGTDLSTCAQVAYNTTLCVATNIVNPGLKITKTQPAESVVCDPIDVVINVTNSGTGNLPNVKVNDDLPAGLTTLDGQSKVAFDVGTLAAGQTRSFTFKAKAAKPGRIENTAQATAAFNMTAESAPVATVFKKPVLTITKTGEEAEFIGRPLDYTITVKNTGDFVARNTVVTDTLPAGSVFVSADQGGVASANTVTWNAGDLAPGASKTYNLTIRADTAAVLENRVSATAACADAVAATARSVVTGIPALLLEVVDVQDPVELGNDHTYIITVTNQGSAAATNIDIKAILEDEMQFLSAGGQTPGQGAGLNVSWGRLASLAPRATATWELKVKAIGEGDVRLAVEMNASELNRPVNETESSNFYK
jgi:uncharacterized repeat protein (TIGR01451 family)